MVSNLGSRTDTYRGVFYQQTFYTPVANLTDRSSWVLEQFYVCWRAREVCCNRLLSVDLSRAELSQRTICRISFSASPLDFCHYVSSGTHTLVHNTLLPLGRFTRDRFERTGNATLSIPDCVGLAVPAGGCSSRICVGSHWNPLQRSLIDLTGRTLLFSHLHIARISAFISALIITHKLTRSSTADPARFDRLVDAHSRQAIFSILVQTVRGSALAEYSTEYPSFKVSCSVPMANRCVLSVSIALVLLGTVSAGFYDDYRIIWGGQNIIANDATSEVKLTMTESAGASFATKDVHLYGSFSVKYKLVPGDSAGTVTAYYMTSYDTKQDEIDFEFLGNVSGQPYLMHTNLFVNGKGSRETQFFLWFDPTADYHNYTIVWNQKQIMWLVDDVPVRIHRNVHPSVYPRLKAMGVHGTLFEASSWATRGGAVPIDWTKGPFSVSYKDFTYRSCKVYNGNTYPCRVDVKRNAWEKPEYQALSAAQKAQLRDVRARYMTYDYCSDRVRYPIVPMECAGNAQGYAL